MSRLDAFFGRLQAAGVDLVLGRGINFSSGLSAARNPATKYVDVTASVPDGSVTPTMLAVSADDTAVPFIIGPVAFSAGPGAADDVTVLEGAEFGFTILDVVVHLSTPYFAATGQLRTATGGGGSALSSSLDLQTPGAGMIRNNDTAVRAVAEGGDVYLRRSIDFTAGTVYILAVRT